MLFGLLSRQTPSLRRERSLRRVVEAANAADYTSVEDLLTEDFTFSDVHGDSVTGRDRFIREDRRFREAAGNPQLVLESVDHSQGEVLIRGYMEGGVEEVSGTTTWRVRFRGAKLAHVEVTRALSHVTMPAFASRREASEA